MSDYEPLSQRNSIYFKPGEPPIYRDDDPRAKPGINHRPDYVVMHVGPMLPAITHPRWVRIGATLIMLPIFCLFALFFVAFTVLFSATEKQYLYKAHDLDDHRPP